MEQLLCYRRYLFFCLELYTRYNWWLMGPNTQCNPFSIRHSVLTYTRNLKTTDCMQTFYISNNCSTIGDIYVCVRARCEIRMVSYTSKHAMQSLSDKPFLRIQCTKTHNSKLQILCGCSSYRTTAILSETFFVWFRVALEIQLESYGLRHSSVIIWYVVCVTAYYSPNDCFIANDASFYEQSCLATLHVPVSFPLIIYAIIKIAITGTIVPLCEFAA